MILLQHLQHPAQRLLEEYFTAKCNMMYKQLVYNFIQGGKDVSDLLRGKIQTMEEFLQMKDLFSKVDNLEKTVKDEEERLKGAK